jgi:chromosome segregation ATPase
MYSATELTSLGGSSQSDDIDMIRESGRSVIAAKDAEIARLNREINEAEQQLDEGLQLGADNECRINDEIAQLEQELERITQRCQAQLDVLREQHDREISDVNARNAREIAKLRAQIDRAQVDQDGLAQMANRAHDLRHNDAEHQLDSAKTRLKEVRAEVARLEAELQKATNEQQQRIGDARTEQAAVAELREEMRRQAEQASDRLRRAKEKNTDLDKQLAEVRAQKEQNLRKSKPAKGKKSLLSDTSRIDAEVIRLTNENEELREILRELDKLAYDVNK